MLLIRNVLFHGAAGSKAACQFTSLRNGFKVRIGSVVDCDVEAEGYANDSRNECPMGMDEMCGIIDAFQHDGILCFLWDFLHYFSFPFPSKDGLTMLETLSYDTF